VLALYIAAGLGGGVSALFLLSAAQNPAEYGVSAFAFFSLALMFYAGLALFARRLSRPRVKRQWMVGCAGISLLFAVLSGGPGGFVVFGPSIAILLWLAIRGYSSRWHAAP
jgi:4-amino-4-deoxy-L-arabinose transferase-like glycosyltransferase